MMTMAVYVLFVTLCVIGAEINGYQFPENFSRCSLSDKDLDQCLVGAIDNAIHLIGNSGIPSLNLPPIDPIGISNIQFGTRGGSVNLVLQYHNCSIYGLSDVKVTKAHFDHREKILTFTTRHPEILQRAQYNLTGKVLMFAVYGHGDSTARLKEPTFSHVVTFKEHTKQGKTYFHVEKYLAIYTITGAHLDFRNLFNGDEKLSKIVLEAVNDNWQLISEEIREAAQKAYGRLGKVTANVMFDSLPVDEIFSR